MNKKRIILLPLLLVLIFCSCSSNNNNTTQVNNSAYSQLDNIDVIYKQNKNYTILSNEDTTIFHYYIKDDNGNIIDEGYHDWRGRFDISQKNNFLVMNYGFGGNAWYERYYDTTNGRVSRFFEKPIANADEFVAYFVVTDTGNEIVLIVQNMFDPNIYYKEIRKDFSDYVIKEQVSAEFSEDNSKLKISYWTNPDNENVTEIIDL